MITRKEIDRRLKASEGLYTNAVVQMLDEEAAKYQSLADASVAWAKEVQRGKTENALGNRTEFMYKQILPFLPPPLLSEKLDKLAEEEDKPGWMHAELHQLADEARELEK